MVVKFSKIERAAGLFVIIAFLTFTIFTLIAAVKQGWFASRLHFKTTFAQGDGLHTGTMVQMAGLRAGSVDSVFLNDNNQIEVTLSVSHEFINRVKKDSQARVIRPFVISEKVVEITVGSKESTQIAENEFIASEETLDIMDLLGGGRLGPYLKTMDSLLRNLQVVAEAFADPRRPDALIGMFDEFLPTMRDFREMSRQMTGHKNLQTSIENLSKLTTELNTMLPAMKIFSEKLPELGDNSAKTMEQMAKLTEEFNKFLPIMTEIAPKLPEASQKGVEALTEAVIVLKAMQRSFLLRGSVKEVQEEQAKLREEESKNQNQNPDEKREPANQ